MNPQQAQASSPQDTPQAGNPTAKANQAAASLAFATHLQNQMLQHQAPAPQEPQNAPKPAKGEETMKDSPKPDIDIDMEALKSELQKDIHNSIKEEMSGIRDEIKKALNEEQD